MPTLSQRDKEVIQDADKLLTDLSTEFNVPKPYYCIYKVVSLKKLGWITTNSGLKPRMKCNDPFRFGIGCGAVFVSIGRNIGYIMLFARGNRDISRELIVHEFFHYKRFIEEGYDNWKNRSREEGDKEEKRTQSETRKYMKKLKETK